MVEQGLSFTVIDAPHPLEATDVAQYDARKQFRAAYRVWLGGNVGTDWLHDAIENEFGEDMAWYDVQSRRNATHVGAAGEVATVVLIMMGAGVVDFLRKYYSGFAQRLGETSADALLEWARERSRERRKERDLEQSDGPPNFFDRDTKALAFGMASELADVLDLPRDRLQVVEADRDDQVALRAIYRDRVTGEEYETVAYKDSAEFRPRTEAPPSTPREQSPATEEAPAGTPRRRRPWRRS